MPAALSSCGCETVTILDWDDTLLASSFLAAKGFNRLDVALHRGPEIDAQLKQLEHAVIAILTRAAEFGRVHIITNAETGWVQLSAQTFLPGVLPYLDKVRISSARSQYEPVFPAAPVQWKYCEFHDKILSSGAVSGLCATDEMERNVVSLGDSRVEREAVLTVCRGLPRTRCKSIKFAERPTLEQLRLQLELVTQCYSDICRHDGDLDLQLALFADIPSPPPSPSTPNSSESMDTDSVPTRPRPPSQSAQPTHARVQLVGYQPPVMTPMSPFAVACGAYSQLVVNPNGTAVVVPVSQPAAAQQTQQTTTPANNNSTQAAKPAATATLNAGVEVTEVATKALVASDELMCARTAQQAAVSVMS